MTLAPIKLAAVADKSGYVLVATQAYLSLQNPANLDDNRRLLPGAHVPRAVTLTDWPYLVLSPAGDRMNLLALRLLK